MWQPGGRLHAKNPDKVNHRTHIILARGMYSTMIVLYCMYLYLHDKRGPPDGTGITEVVAQPCKTLVCISGVDASK